MINKSLTAYVKLLGYELGEVPAVALVLILDLIGMSLVVEDLPHHEGILHDGRHNVSSVLQNLRLRVSLALGRHQLVPGYVLPLGDLDGRAVHGHLHHVQSQVLSSALPVELYQSREALDLDVSQGLGNPVAVLEVGNPALVRVAVYGVRLQREHHAVAVANIATIVGHTVATALLRALVLAALALARGGGLVDEAVEALEEHEGSVVHEGGLGAYGVPARTRVLGNGQLAPGLQEVLYLGTAGVHYPEAGYVDGAVLNDLALPPLVHNLDLIFH